MELNSVGAVNSTYQAYEADTNKAVTSEKPAEAVTVEEGAVFEKSSGEEKKATYSINKMSPEDRAAFVQQLKDDQAARKQSFIDMVTQMFQGQGKAIAIADSDNEDSLWKMLASGDFTVDAQTKAQAEKDIAEDGYWGISQTSQRLFDFASALAGDDVDKMKEMQDAMEQGFKQATGTWGKDLPEISQNTLDAANKLFDDYYKSKGIVE
ncbi:MAG: hypothetical protein Q4D29_06190 [Lachnospiraceae bacterium]|nr:hypothetical protein [Lachnospiraceae bacterium]